MHSVEDMLPGRVIAEGVTPGAREAITGELESRRRSPGAFQVSDHTDGQVSGWTRARSACGEARIAGPNRVGEE
jgi:hypothetical protein